MRANVEIDGRLMREALRVTGLRTESEAVDLALRELVTRHQRLSLLSLGGRIQWEGDLEVSRQDRRV